MKKAIILATLTLILFGCKKPDAGFTTDSNQYGPGDEIKFTNTSTNAKKYKWTFPDGTTSTSQNPTYKLPDDQPLGAVDVKLETQTSSGKTKDEVSRSIDIGGTGDLVFWTKNEKQYTVVVDDTKYGYYNQLNFATGPPECGDTRFANFNLSVGVHKYKIIGTSSNTLASGTILIKRNTCIATEF